MFLATPPRRRNLVLNHAKRLADSNRRRNRFLAAHSPYYSQTPLTSFANDEPTRADEPVDPGEELPFSFYRPSLQGGVYSAQISHDITIKESGGVGTANMLKLSSSHKFRVVASRFALEDGDIAGFYPPQGQGDYNHILPHIIFHDQHLPWIRSGTKTTEQDSRNTTPWLALLVFTNDELTLLPSEDLLPAGKEQDSTGGVLMTFREIFALQRANKIASPFSESDPEKIDPDMNAKFVFVPEHVFRSLFCTYNQDGSPKELSDGQTPDTSRYKFLAHCRKINTEGLPENIATEDAQRLFSIVVSHRTAPVDFTETTSVSVHLVSIEYVENVKSIPTGKRVAMCSLYSWTYNVFPASLPTLQEKLEDLGRTLNVLRPPQTVFDSLGEGSSIPPDVVSRLKERSQEGYTLVRYRVSTGDQTMAFMRSPFVPGLVKCPMPNLPSQSLTSGTDLQILDQHLGIMDITYSSAWQLGKSLAFADRSFATALVRIRTQIGNTSVKKARLEMAKQHGRYHTLEETISGLTKSITLLSEPFQVIVADVDAASQSWHRPSKALLDLSFANPDFCSRLEHHCCKVVSTLSTATDGTMFAEHNTPESPDWQRVFSFLLDCLYLYAVPPHYLLPDPTLLPEESLRFFTIDKNWTDALIDGALSVANHQLPQLDMATRKAIRAELDKYLDTVDPALRYKPQVPKFGMLLRSDIVALFPGLAIRAPNPNPTDLRAPILRQTTIADGTLLVLFDRIPGSEEFKSLTIQMPPHEQRFSVGSTINGDSLEVHWKRIYTSDAPTKPYKELKTSEYNRGGGANETESVAIYDWSSRTLNMHSYTDTALKYLKELMEPGKFIEDATTSTLAAIQLNDPLYEMSIVRRGLTESYCPITMAFGPLYRSLSLKEPPISVWAQSQSISLCRWYTYGMWPASKIPKERPPDGEYQHPFSKVEYAIDIVFSIIRRQDRKPSTERLSKIEVQLPLIDNVALIESYDGPGGYLASNMRWTYALFAKRDSQLLRVGILPRDDTNNSSPVADNRDLTFVLKGCKLNKQLVGPWYARFEEHYVGKDVPVGRAVWYKIE